ncbi:MAG: class I SAM-dependent methyltransferase [Actinomycetota bacterium]
MQSPDKLVYSVQDLRAMLDDLLADRGGAWWDGFYTDRARQIPFFVEWPDENLVQWFGQGLLRPGRVLELGCGNGRNAVYLSAQGCQVDAVDFSARAIGWARERAAAAGAQVSFQCGSIFDAGFADGSYDLVYDSGCFHHLPPHRRQDYVELVLRVLPPGGGYGLVCFRPDGGSGRSDQQVYEQRGLGGGLGYTRERLQALWDGRLDIRQLRQMRHPAADEALFGEDFLWALLAGKPDQPAVGTWRAAPGAATGAGTISARCR